MCSTRARSGRTRRLRQQDKSDACSRGCHRRLRGRVARYDRSSAGPPDRYRRVYGADVCLDAVCGSLAGLADPFGLEPGRLNTIEPGLSGPDFIGTSGDDIRVEAGPSDLRTGNRALPTSAHPSRPGATPSSSRRGRSSIAGRNCALWRGVRFDAEARRRGRRSPADHRPHRTELEGLRGSSSYWRTDRRLR